MTITTKRCRELLAQHGPVEAQPASDWMGDIPLPEAVEAFYAVVGPMDVAIEARGDAYFFPRLASLWDIQAGHRYNMLSGQPIVTWNDDWLVVADHGGEPFVFSRSTGAILHRGAPLFVNIVEMAAALATLGDLARGGALDRASATAALAEVAGDRAEAITTALL